jgi:hypothetical protein
MAYLTCDKGKGKTHELGFGCVHKYAALKHDYKQRGTKLCIIIYAGSRAFTSQELGSIPAGHRKLVFAGLTVAGGLTWTFKLKTEPKGTTAKTPHQEARILPRNCRMSIKGS